MHFISDIPSFVINFGIIFILLAIAALFAWREGVLSERKRVFKKLGLSTKSVRNDYSAGQALDKYAERSRKLRLDEVARNLARDRRKNT